MSGSQVTVHCEKCDSPVLVEVSSEDLASTQDGILRVMLVHGSPQHAIVVYVDKRMRVREIEYSDSFQMGETKSTSVVSADNIATSLSEALGEPCYQALFTFEDVEEREKTTFILDKSILRAVCESGTICLSNIRKKIVHLEKALGTKIDLEQIEIVCEKYTQEGIFRKA